MLARESDFLDVQGHRIEYCLIPAATRDAPLIVFLHEGLGSVAMWRDFPERCAQASGCRGLVYSRFGYGKSDALVGPRAAAFMHDEALKSLPELLDRLGIDRPVLFGHSDGASIALIHAGGSGRRLRGVVAMAPHVMVEEKGIRAIEATKRRYESADLRMKLARYHADPDSAFWGWNNIWLNRDFRSWNIEAYLPKIHCPVLLIQGEDDEYGTMDQIERIESAVPGVETLKLKDCGHSPHRDQPEAVIKTVVRFVERSGQAT